MNSFESVLMRWMKLEPIIQSEVSQKDKDHYSILTHIYMEFRKTVMIILYAKQKKRHRYTEQTFGLWEKARVGCFERTACILSIVKQITSPIGMHETSAQAWCTGKTQRNRVEREVGGGIGMGNTCNSMADSCHCMTKPTAML